MSHTENRTCGTTLVSTGQKILGTLVYDHHEVSVSGDGGKTMYLEIYRKCSVCGQSVCYNLSANTDSGKQDLWNQLEEIKNTPDNCYMNCSSKIGWKCSVCGKLYNASGICTNQVPYTYYTTTCGF